MFISICRHVPYKIQYMVSVRVFNSVLTKGYTSWKKSICGGWRMSRADNTCKYTKKMVTDWWATTKMRGVTCPNANNCCCQCYWNLLHILKLNNIVQTDRNAVSDGHAESYRLHE